MSMRSSKKFQISNFKFQIFQNPKIENRHNLFRRRNAFAFTAEQLEKILDAVHEKFSVDKNAEITMEMNPATMTIETLKDYKSLGVNRASFGAQTFDDTELKRLGRRHTAQDVRETIELLRKANYENVSFDLIAGFAASDFAGLGKKFDRSTETRTRTYFALSA